MHRNSSATSDKDDINILMECENIRESEQEGIRAKGDGYDLETQTESAGSTKEESIRKRMEKSGARTSTVEMENVILYKYT